MELTLARTLEIAEQCESVAHQTSHLSVSEPSKEDARTWEDLKVKNIKCKSEVAPFDRKLYAYASSKPLPVKSGFICELLIGKGKAQAEFLVIKGKRSATPVHCNEVRCRYSCWNQENIAATIPRSI